MEIFRAKYFPDHVQEKKERKFTELVQGSMSVADYEARFSALGRYTPHIFDNPRRKLRKFIDGLKGNIQKHVAICDLESFTWALRITHLVEIENDRFVVEQKSSRKRPWSAPTNHQKDEQARKVGYPHAPPIP